MVYFLRNILKTILDDILNYIAYSLLFLILSFLNFENIGFSIKNFVFKIDLNI